MSTSKDIGKKQWEIENKVKQVNFDDYYLYDADEQSKLLESAPWKKDPKYFKKVKMSALALLKISIHAANAKRTAIAMTEIMGLMQGKIVDDTFIVTDAFALPVEGVEAFVNAGDQATEYIATYTDMSPKVGRMENIVGWYHSHPGFSVWLSGTDVTTQKQNQQVQDPFMAVVIDPLKTISSGKVDIGAFRTYPEHYKPEQSDVSYMSIPKEREADYGKYYNEYYEMEMEFFKSKTDEKLLNLLWNKYWMKTLSSSTLLKNRFYTDGQIENIVSKLDVAENEISRGSRYTSIGDSLAEGKPKKPEETSLSKINKDSVKMSTELLQGIISQTTKNLLFNSRDTKNNENSMEEE